MEDQSGQSNKGIMSTDAIGIDLTQFYQLQPMLETLPESTLLPHTKRQSTMRYARSKAVLCSPRLSMMS